MRSNKITLNINDRQFEVKSHKAGAVWGFPNDPKTDGFHYRHKVFVTERGITKSFMFFGSVSDYDEGIDRLDKDGLIHALDCFFGDAIAGDMEYKDFVSEFGYDWYEETTENIHKACQKALDKINDFGIFTSEVYDLANELREVYEV